MYTYDSIGRLIASCVKSGVTVLMQTRQEYNSNNQLTAQHWTVGDTTYSETYAYNKTEGTLSSMTTGNGHTISLTYDNLRRVSKVDTGTLDRYYTYRTVTGTDGTTTSQVSQLRYGGDTTSYFTYDYTYDVLGNIATYKQNNTTWTYTYDKQSQLTKATSGSTTYSYTYDNAGNITSANGKSYTYGNTVWRDLLTKYDGQYIQYEGQQLSGSTVSGNPTSGNPISYYNGTRWTFDWEEGGNLVSADSTSASVDYAYDQNGLRISKTVDGVKHTYLYASGKLLRESYGTVVLDFFYDQSGYPYAMTYKNGTAAAVTYYYITNLQGDVLTMITGTGTSVASYTYDPYGKPLTATGTMATINPLRYRGYYYDTETGFYYLQSRYYDPAICRFINADSYASTGQGVLGNNMFAYCGNDPVVRKDFNGNSWASFFVTVVMCLLLSGCSSDQSKPEGYDSADEAAAAFAAEIFATSAYLRFEFSTEIYYISYDGETKYYYTEPALGEPHCASGVNMNRVPNGATAVAYVHTHPNTNVFSSNDKDYAKKHGINAYMIGPNMLLQKYNLIGGLVEGKGYIEPIPLDPAQKEALKDLQYIWDWHFEDGKCTSGFPCNNMTWPNG